MLRIDMAFGGRDRALPFSHIDVSVTVAIESFQQLGAILFPFA